MDSALILRTLRFRAVGGRGCRAYLELPDRRVAPRTSTSDRVSTVLEITANP
jgi:hypothetical protein